MKVGCLKGFGFGIALFYGISAADAGIIIGFETTSSPQQAQVTFDGQDLTIAGTSVDVGVLVNSARTLFAAADIDLAATLVTSDPVTVGSLNGTLLTFDGTWSFTSSGGVGGDLFSVAFTGATLLLLDNATSSALVWSNDSGGSIVAGSVAAGLWSPTLYLENPQDFSLALAGLIGSANGFTAYSSFTATSLLVPEPGTLVVLLMGTLTFVHRRRRHTRPDAQSSEAHAH